MTPGPCRQFGNARSTTMADSRYVSRVKAADLRDEILVYEKKPKSLKQKKTCMKRIIANVTMGNNDMVTLFQYVIQYYLISDLDMKYMCCYYFNSYSFANKAILFENRQLFLDDLDHGNSQLQGLVLKTIVLFPNKEFQEDAVNYIEKFSKDGDIYLRRIATYSIGKLFEISPDLVTKAGLIELLNQQLLGNNYAVVLAALAVLDYIMEHSPALRLTMDKESVVNLFSLLPKADGFSQAYILNSFLSYVPSTSEDAHLLLEKTIPYLQHESTPVVVNCLKVIVYLANYVRAPHEAIPTLLKRLGNSLISLLSKPAEIQFLVLRNVILLLLSKPNLVRLDVTMFFCQFQDPIYIKDTKLEIIYLLANSNNLTTVLRELEEYATEVDQQMARKAIRAIGNLAIKLDDAATSCADVLANLSASGIPTIVQETVIVWKNIYRKYPGKYEKQTIGTIVSYSDLIEDPEAKCSFLWIVGSYPELIPLVLDLLKDFTHTIKQDLVDVQLTLLTAVVKYYIRYSQLGEELLLKILKIVTEELDNPDLRDRGFFYWRLLSSQKAFPESAQDVVNGELPIIKSDQEKLDPLILGDLELSLGSLASIYLKPVKQVFRLAKSKSLVDSPALQVHYNSSIQPSDANEVAEHMEEKVLHINSRSNIGTIKSPKIGGGNFNSGSEASSRFEDDDEFGFNSAGTFDRGKLAGSSSDENVDNHSSLSPKLGALKRRMTFARKKPIVSPNSTLRNFTT